MNRNEAIKLGQKTYNGKPCVSCGKTEKYVSNWSCVECTTNSTKNRSPDVYKKYINSEKGSEWKKNYRKTKVYRDVQKKWVLSDYENNKEKYIGYSLKKYGLTIENYNALKNQQDNKCMICNTHENELNQRLAVDHCHTTGIVRGLLCGPCNTSLGLLKEDENIMKNMIEYIQRFKCELL